MTVKTRPYYTLPASELAQWLEKQGDNSWWSVDGDPLLTGLVAFPCPGSELARELRRLGGKLQLQDKDDNSRVSGQPISAANLEEHAYCEHGPDRSFVLSWPAAPEGSSWILTEDHESAELFSESE